MSPDLTKMQTAFTSHQPSFFDMMGESQYQSYDNNILVVGTRNLAPVSLRMAGFLLLSQWNFGCQLQINRRIQFVFDLDNTHDLLRRHELIDFLCEFLLNHNILHFY